MPIILAFSFLRTLKVLTYTSLLGNLLVITGCVTVIIYGIMKYFHYITLDHNFVEWDTLPKYVGGNIFLFAIHVVIFPLLQQMENQDNNENKRQAIKYSYIFITVLNSLFGSIGFLLFADSVCVNGLFDSCIGPCDNVLSNVSDGSLLDIIKILICIDLLVTIPLILAASRAIIEKGILDTSIIKVGRHKYLNRIIDKNINRNINKISATNDNKSMSTHSDHYDTITNRININGVKNINKKVKENVSNMFNRMKKNGKITDDSNDCTDNKDNYMNDIDPKKSIKNYEIKVANSNNVKIDEMNIELRTIVDIDGNISLYDKNSNSPNIDNNDEDILAIKTNPFYDSMTMHKNHDGNSSNDNSNKEKNNQIKINSEKINKKDLTNDKKRTNNNNQNDEIKTNSFLFDAIFFDDDSNYANNYDNHSNYDMHENINSNINSSYSGGNKSNYNNNDSSDSDFIDVDIHSTPITKKKINGYSENAFGANTLNNINRNVNLVKAQNELIKKNARYTLIIQYIIRLMLVIIVIVMAVSIPRFGDMIVLVGGVVCAFTGFVLPPVIYMRLRYKLYQLHVPMNESTTINQLTHNKSISVLNLPMNSTRYISNFNIMDRFKGLNNINVGNIIDNGLSIIDNNINSFTQGVVNYVEKKPMSYYFIFCHILICIFGLVTMCLTMFYTLIDIKAESSLV